MPAAFLFPNLGSDGTPAAASLRVPGCLRQCWPADVPNVGLLSVLDNRNAAMALDFYDRHGKPTIYTDDG